MKRTAMGHPKLVRLAALLNVPQYAAVGIMECVWHFTAKHAITGNVGKWTDEEIAVQIGWDRGDAARLISAMVDCRLLDSHPTHRLVVHDWHEHCDESCRKTVKNKRLVFVTTPDSASQGAAAIPQNSKLFENFQERSRNLLPKPEPEPEPEPEPKPSSSAPKFRSDEADREFAEFMLERIRNVLPGFKSPNLSAWGNTIRLTREIDHRSLEDLRNIFKFANSDPFWQSNILSPEKLRKQFDTLQAKMKVSDHGPKCASNRSSINSSARIRTGEYSNPEAYGAQEHSHDSRTPSDTA